MNASRKASRTMMWLGVLGVLAGCSAAPADESADRSSAAVTGVCSAEADALSEAKLEEQQASADLAAATSITERQAAIAEIRRATADEHNANQAYDACMLAHGGKSELMTSLGGTATLSIASSNSRLAGPFVSSVSVGLDFAAWSHTSMTVTSFPAIAAGPFDTGVGMNTTTVTIKSGTTATGTFDPTTGAATLDLTLHFANSMSIAGDSDATFHLSTAGTGGHPLDSSNTATLTGTSTFSGGFLGGLGCTLNVTGTLANRP